MRLHRAIPSFLAACLAVGSACAQPGGSLPELGSASNRNETPQQAQGVEVVENLGAQLPLELPFTASDGTTAPLAAYFDGEKPVVLALVYYDCPIVCTIVMDKLTTAFKGIDFGIGEDYRVVFASIDPTEPASLAASVKQRYLLHYERPVAEQGWGFLTSESGSTRQLAQTLGWNYKPIAGGEFSHPVCIFVCTPEGKVARYVYGVGYEPDTMRMALLEASDGKISQSIGDKVRMFCFRYDPSTGKYALAALRVVQLGGVASMLVVGTLVAVMLTKERLRHRRAQAAADDHQPNNPAAGSIS